MSLRRPSSQTRSTAPQTGPARQMFDAVRQQSLACRPLVGRGLPAAVDARRQPHQVAPGAHHLVLRDLRARALRAALPPFDAAFRVLFNSYYQGVGHSTRAPQRGLISRAPLDEVRRLPAEVDERRARGCWRERPTTPDWSQLVTLGLHHEQQHQELLLTDIKHALILQPAAPAYAPAAGR